jgi:hypothetical protein
MCLDCNCGKPNDNHGDPSHITLEMVQKAAKASQTDPETVADRIHQQVKQARDQGNR